MTDPVNERVGDIVREGVYRAYSDADDRPVEPEEGSEGFYEAWDGPDDIAIAWDHGDELPF